MTMEEANDIHRRFNPLTNSWVLCSPHRAKRPWQGQNEKPVESASGEYDPKCYLCPGNSRATDSVNPDYASTYIFPNDFPALIQNSSSAEESAALKPAANSPLESALFHKSPAAGTCKVICFSPKHNLTVAEMNASEIESVIDSWIEAITNLTNEGKVKYVQVFENKGSVMGCSNPHPHGQVWATDYIPDEPEAEFKALSEFKRVHGTCMLCAYAKMELEKNERVVYSNSDFIVVVPYWAVWPFETLVVPTFHINSLTALTQSQKQNLALALQAITIRYDNLFETSFPYSMGVHGAPVKMDKDIGAPGVDAHLHIHFYPPLLRSATVKKFLVGFEMLGESQRDLTAEMAAARLKACDGNVHYKKKSLN